MTADLRIRLTPRADRDAVTGVRDDGVVLVRVSAPPVEGRANEALCRVLAERLGVPPSRVAVVRGHGAREKVVRVEGLDEAEARARLDAAAR
ncbi:MAG TPA: DUF167 domain-containing protein [Baekduia sp.]|nr:DUF167 domain-containing protein [Baekduia sp.]